MKNKGFIVSVVIIVGAWLAVELTRTRFLYKIAINRNNQVSVLMESIQDIKASMTDPNDVAAVSARDLHSMLEINRLEGQIRDLRMENAIDQARGDSNSFPEVFYVVLLVLISWQIGKINKEPKSDN